VHAYGLHGRPEGIGRVGGGGGRVSGESRKMSRRRWRARNRICIQLIQIYHRLYIRAASILLSRIALPPLPLSLSLSRQTTKRMRARRGARKLRPTKDVGALVDPKRAQAVEPERGASRGKLPEEPSQVHRDVYAVPPFSPPVQVLIAEDYSRQDGLAYICFCHKT